ncbi:MAG: hypothetical protein HY901_11690 [Deltaproteobacteria bacterium]|nr:hypothetical protein [Deltaproteobacteria bacterium]
MDHSRALPPLVLAVWSTGCVAMPLAVPPMQLAVGSGARSLSSDSCGEDLDAPAQLRVAVHPLALFPGMLNRSADVGVGYLLDYGANAQIQGGYLEGSMVMLQKPLRGGLGRLSTRIQTRLIYADPEASWGLASALQLTGEWVSFADSDFETTSADGGAFGHSYGEGGIGLFIEGSYQRAGTLHGWTATGGILIRVPASAGIAYVWAWTLL